jgi:hypothetical protein
MVDIVTRLLRKAEEARPSLKQPVIDLTFDNLRKDPIACVKHIHTVAGDTLSPEAEARMSTWIGANKQNKHGKHEYAAEDVGLDLASLRPRFDFYRHRYTQ